MFQVAGEAHELRMVSDVSLPFSPDTPLHGAQRRRLDRGAQLARDSLVIARVDRKIESEVVEIPCWGLWRGGVHLGGTLRGWRGDICGRAIEVSSRRA